jgi:photosystem II stability/assembly factor-like uncharacterized protein
MTSLFRSYRENKSMMRTLLALIAGAALSGQALAQVPEPVLPASGPLAKVTMQRLLLTDAARIGNRVVAVGDHGYIVYSDDNGTSWKRAKAPLAPLLTSVTFADMKNGWAVGHDSVILASADAGENWAQQFSAPSEQRPLLDVLFLDKDNGFAVGAYGAFYETADSGKTWSPRKILNDDKHLNAIVRAGEGKLLILGEAGTILASGDNAKTWTAVPPPYKGSLFGAVVADDGAIVSFGMRGRIFRSGDSGKTWKQIDNASVASLMGGSKLPDGALVIAGAAGMVLVSRDNGQSFVPLPTGSTKAYAKALLGAPNAVLLLGEAGARDVLLPSARR